MNENKIENKNESFEFWLYLGIKLMFYVSLFNEKVFKLLFYYFYIFLFLI